MNACLKHRNAAGFTLIEVMVTLLIILVVMLGSGSFITWTLSMDALARERTYATHIGEEWIEEWAATNKLDIDGSGVDAAPAAGSSITWIPPLYPGLGVPLTLVATANSMTAPSPDGSGSMVLTGTTTTPIEKIIKVQWKHKGVTKEIFFTHATLVVAP